MEAQEIKNMQLDPDYYINPLTMLEAMSDEYFTNWLRLDNFGNDTGIYEEDVVLGIYDIVKDNGLDTKEVILLKLLQNIKNARDNRTLDNI